MRRSTTVIDADMLPLGSQGWDWVMGGVLGVLLVFLPAAFGTVEAWSHLIAFAVTGLLLGILLLRLIADQEFRLARTWLYAPLLLLVLFTALQTAALPTTCVRALAPASVAIREEFLANSAPERLSISLYPYATAAFVRLFLMAAAVFVTIVSLVRTSQHVKFLLATVFGVGCAEALLSLAQIVTGTENIYWVVPVSGGVRTAGTFVNYSNFAQFMNLSIGAGLGLLLVRLAEQHRDARDDYFLQGAIRSYWEKNALVCVGLAICALAILASLSRNGAVAMLVAGTVVGLTLLRRSSLSIRGWIVATVPAIALVFLFIYGFDFVYARMASLQDTAAYGLRWEMTRAAFRAWQQFPWWGTGFGTHEMVAPQFEHVVTAVLAGHADNDYAQLLEETGVVGVAVVIAFVIGIGALLSRLVLWGHKPCAVAAYGILYALVAVAIQSATDFGLRLPANMILLATFGGLTVSLARIESRRPNASPRTDALRKARPPWLRLLMVLLAIVLCTAVWGWGLRDAYAAYLGERWWAAASALDVRMQKNSSATTEEDFTNLIASAEGAFRSDPGNVQYGYWLNEYRWEAVSRAAFPAEGTTLPEAERSVVGRIADELAHVRTIAPTYGPPYALEGQLRLFVLHEPSGANLIRQGVRLANYDPPTCLVAGQLAATEEQQQEAETLLSRALQLQPAYFSDVLAFCLRDRKDIHLARTLAGSDHRRLFELAAAAEQIPEFSPQAPALRATAEQTLRDQVGRGNANPDDLVQLAQIERERRAISTAIDLYRRALGAEYQRSDWRVQLAELLVAAGQTDDAIHELKIVLRLRPREPSATKLLEQLVMRGSYKSDEPSSP